MVVLCLLLTLLSLIALSWRKYGGIIMRALHDPQWKVRSFSPSTSPTLKANKKTE